MEKLIQRLGQAGLAGNANAGASQQQAQDISGPRLTEADQDRELDREGRRGIAKIRLGQLIEQVGCLGEALRRGSKSVRGGREALLERGQDAMAQVVA